MKLIQKQPICITRLKKKPSHCNIDSAEDYGGAANSRAQLAEIALNPILDSRQFNDNFSNPSYYGRFQGSQNSQVISDNKNMQVQKFSPKSEKVELMRRVNYLEIVNEQLSLFNQDLIKIIEDDKQQIRVLNERVQRLEKSIEGLSKDFHQEFSIKKSGKPAFIEELMFTPKCRQIDLTKPIESTPYRRMSLHDSFDSEGELSSKVKQYKNQFESEKIRRLNLERELSLCKQNVRIELNTEIDRLVHKIENMKIAIQRKDKEIHEKEDLIQRYILKK